MPMNVPYTGSITGWSIQGDTRFITVQIKDSMGNPAGNPYTFTIPALVQNYDNVAPSVQQCANSQMVQDAALQNPSDPLGGLLTALQGISIKPP